MKNKTDFSIKLLITILSISLSSPSFADDDEPRWYQIELIVFSNNNLQETVTETWPEEPGRPSDKNYTELVSSIPQPIIEAPIDVSEVADEQIIDEQQIRAEQAEKLLQIEAESTIQTENPAMNESLLNEDTNSNNEDEEIILPFGIVSSEGNRLTLSAQKIDRSEEYDLLLHVNWRQPVFTPKDKSAVYLHDTLNDVIKEMLAVPEDATTDPDADQNTITEGNSYLPLVTDPADPLISNTTSEYPFGLSPDQIPLFEESAENEFAGPDAQRFFGAFRLSLSRFLHIDIDLAYRTEIDTQPKETQDPMTDVFFDNQPINTDNLFNDIEDIIFDDRQPTLKEFRLLESRRIKPDEIHYFDHPAFGVIVMVTRYELPKPKEEEEPLMQQFLP